MPRIPAGFRYVPYGTGNAHNTWYACTIVDAEGKEVPWVDRDGRVLDTISQRYRPGPGQDYFLYSGRISHRYRGPSLVPDLPERIARGEFKLPCTPTCLRCPSTSAGPSSG